MKKNNRKKKAYFRIFLFASSKEASRENESNLPYAAGLRQIKLI